MLIHRLKTESKIKVNWSLDDFVLFTSSSSSSVRRLESQQIGHVSRSAVTKPSKSTRKQKKIVERNEEESSVNSMTLAESYARKTLTGRGVFYDIGLFVGIFFVCLHLYLCYKLYAIDRILSSSTTTCEHRLPNCFENNPKSNWWICKYSTVNRKIFFYDFID